MLGVSLTAIKAIIRLSLRLFKLSSNSLVTATRYGPLGLYIIIKLSFLCTYIRHACMHACLLLEIIIENRSE